MYCFLLSFLRGAFSETCLWSADAKSMTGATTMMLRTLLLFVISSFLACASASHSGTLSVSPLSTSTRTMSVTPSYVAGHGAGLALLGLTWTTTQVTLTSTFTSRTSTASPKKLSITPSTDGTMSSTESAMVTLGSQSNVDTVTQKISKSLPSISRRTVSMTKMVSSSPSPTRMTSRSKSGSLSTTNSVSSTVTHQPTRSHTWVPSPTETVVQGTSKTLLPTLSPSGLQWGDANGIATATATRSPSRIPRRMNGTYSHSLRNTLTTTNALSKTVSESTSRSSSNYLPGQGANFKFFHPTYGFFADPSTCSPKLLLVEIPVIGLLILVAIVYMYKSQCGATSVVNIDEPTHRPSPFRFMVAHHAYLSCLFPCHLRCAPLHVMELLSHMSVSMVISVGSFLGVPVDGDLSLGTMTAISLGSVTAAAIVRFGTSWIGWKEGAARVLHRQTEVIKNVYRTEDSVKRLRPKQEDPRYFETSSSSDDEKDFPAAFARKEKKRRKRLQKDGKDIHDYVAAYIEERKPRRDDQLYEDDRSDDDEVREKKDEAADDEYIWGSAAEAAAKAAEEKLKASGQKWLFDVEDGGYQEEADVTDVVEQHFSLPVRVPKLRGTRFRDDHEESLKKIAIGTNWVVWALVLHAALWIVAWGGSFIASSLLEARGGVARCQHVNALFGVHYLVWDICCLQVAYAAIQGWRAGAWKCCCKVVVSDRTKRVGEDDEEGINLADVRDLELHPRY